MKTIIKEIPVDIHFFQLSTPTYWFDIETDGLGHKSRIAILGGIFLPAHSNHGILYQLFNDDGLSEKEILLTWIQLLKNHAIYQLISFNGDSFDIPFLNARLREHHVPFRINKAFNVDLYRLIKKNHHIFNLDNYKLKTIEKFLGIHREDTISGKDSVDLYLRYLKEKNTKDLEKILLHNADDLINMLYLNKIFDFLPYQLNDYLVETFKHGHLCFALAHINNDSSTLFVSLELQYDFFSKPYFIEQSALLLDANEQTLSLRFNLIHLSDELTILNPKSIEGKNFNSLDHEIKQQYIYQYKEEFYPSNLLQIIKKLLMRFNID